MKWTQDLLFGSDQITNKLDPLLRCNVNCGKSHKLSIYQSVKHLGRNNAARMSQTYNKTTVTGLCPSQIMLIRKQKLFLLSNPLRLIIQWTGIQTNDQQIFIRTKHSTTLIQTNFLFNVVNQPNNSRLLHLVQLGDCHQIPPTLVQHYLPVRRFQDSTVRRRRIFGSFIAVGWLYL